MTLRTAAIAALVATSQARDLAECVCFLNDTSCTGDSWKDQCDDYYKSIGYTIWIGIFGMLFFLIALPMILIIRRCCNGCGGHQPSKGLCYPKRNEYFEGYSTSHVLILKFLIFGILGASLAFGIPVITQSNKVSGSIDDVGGYLDQLIVEVDEAIDVVKTDFQAIPDVDLSEIIAEIEKVESQMDDVRNGKKDMIKYDHNSAISRDNWTVGIMCGVCGCFLLAVLIAVCSITKFFPYLILSFLIIVGLGVAIVTTFYQITGLLTHDFCNDYDNVSGNLIRRAEHELGCNPNSTTGLADIIIKSNEGMQKFQTRICADVMPQINAAFTYQQTVCTPPDWRQFVPILNNSNTVNTAAPYDTCRLNPQDNCSIADCADRCQQGSPIQLQCAQLVNAALFKNIEDEVYPVANCTVLRTFVGQMESPICDLKSSTSSVWGLTAVLLACAAVGSIAVMLGIKRFAPLHSEYRDLSHEQQQPQEVYPTPAPPVASYGTAQPVRGGAQPAYGV